MTDPVYLLGATASGKHSAAVEVAEALGAEIISVDSMKVYRGMDLGTAKPSADVLGRVRHHLIDNCAPEEVYSAGRFVEDAAAAEEDIRRRGMLPFFVGGTALYYKAYMYGLFRGPSADPQLREELIAVAQEQGSASLHRELQRVDVEAAARIHPHDLRRLVRALEVFRKTGEPITKFQTQFEAPGREGKVVWLDRDREDLRIRLAVRTRKMFEGGLVEEVKKLMAAPWGKEGRNAVGYREIVDLIEGRCTREEAQATLNRRTDKFIRRQRTWFRSFPEARAIPVGADDSLASVVDRIRKEFGS